MTNIIEMDADLFLNGFVKIAGERKISMAFLDQQLGRIKQEWLEMVEYGAT